MAEVIPQTELRKGKTQIYPNLKGIPYFHTYNPNNYKNRFNTARSFFNSLQKSDVADAFKDTKIINAKRQPYNLKQ